MAPDPIIEKLFIPSCLAIEEVEHRWKTIMAWFPIADPQWHNFFSPKFRPLFATLPYKLAKMRLSIHNLKYITTIVIVKAGFALGRPKAARDEKLIFEIKKEWIQVKRKILWCRMQVDYDYLQMMEEMYACESATRGGTYGGHLSTQGRFQVDEAEVFTRDKYGIYWDSFMSEEGCTSVRSRLTTSGGARSGEGWEEFKSEWDETGRMAERIGELRGSKVKAIPAYSGGRKKGKARKAEKKAQKIAAATEQEMD